jgi:hypothetical protein
MNSEGVYVIITLYHVHSKMLIVLIAVFKTDGHYFTSLASWNQSTPPQLTSPKLIILTYPICVQRRAGENYDSAWPKCL